MKPEKDLPPYTYACTDRSVLVQPVCRFVVAPFARWMPATVPANFLTLGSSLCMGLMLPAAVSFPSVATAAAACALLMLGYILYDHADGMHARRTGTSSPLGEYLDHYLDAFNGPIAIAAMFLIAGQKTNAALLPVVGAVAMASTATMLEQRETRMLYFGLVGPLEGMLLTLGFLASWSLPSASTFWLSPTPWPGTWFSTVSWLGFAGGLLTVAGSLMRIGRIPAPFLLYVASTVVLGWYPHAPGQAWWCAPLLLTLHGSDYTGRLLGSHLRGTRRPVPDVLAPVTVALALALADHQPWITAVVATYLGARNLATTISNLRAFRQFWRWRNA